VHNQQHLGISVISFRAKIAQVTVTKILNLHMDVVKVQPKVKK